MIVNKTQQVKSLVAAGDFKEALKITKTFKLGLTPDQKKTLSLGYEAIVHPAFYIQLKQDVKALQANAEALLKQLYA